MILVGSASLHAEITLSDKSGRKATLEVTEVTCEAVDFTIAGRKGSIKIRELSDVSREEVITYAKAKNIYRAFPELVVQVKVVNQRRNDADTWYRRNVKLVSSMVIEGLAKLLPIPGAEATIVLITQDTRAKYVKHIEKLKVYATDTVSVPAAPSGDRREFFFKIVELSHDAARDPTNVGGDEYKYYIFGLRDAETKQLIDFQTNSPALERLAAEHPEVRDRLLGSREKADFPPDFSKN